MRQTCPCSYVGSTVLNRSFLSVRTVSSRLLIVRITRSYAADWSRSTVLHAPSGAGDPSACARLRV